MTDPNSSLSHLDLETPEKPFLDANELVINMGPQHPATHGVLRVILRLDGEKVLGLECVIGYLHRGVEKIGEHRTYTMFNPYVDRMDYVAAVSNGLGYCETVEKLLNVEAPPRAQHVRVILTELNRIASHQLMAGNACPRYRRHHAALLHFPRPRRNSEDLRKILRRPPYDSRFPHRRPPIRDLRRLRKRCKEFPQFLSSQNRRIRRTAHHEPNLG